MSSRVRDFLALLGERLGPGEQRQRRWLAERFGAMVSEAGFESLLLDCAESHDPLERASANDVRLQWELFKEMGHLV